MPDKPRTFPGATEPLFEWQGFKAQTGCEAPTHAFFLLPTRAVAGYHAVRLCFEIRGALVPAPACVGLARPRHPASHSSILVCWVHSDAADAHVSLVVAGQLAYVGPVVPVSYRNR